MGSMKKSVLLLCCGSFNPVTNMHLRILELARDALHKTNAFKVLGGVISPTNDGYKKQGLIESKHRVEMVRIATQTSNWIRVNTWEADQPEWQETLKVLKYIKEYANETYKDTASDVGVKLVCGADLMESFAVPNLWKDQDIESIVGDYGLVVITRAGANPEKYIDEHHILKKLKENIHVVEEWIPNEISATKIRLALKQGESIKYLLPDPVIDYIAHNGLYQ